MVEIGLWCPEADGREEREESELGGCAAQFLPRAQSPGIDFALDEIRRASCAYGCSNCDWIHSNAMPGQAAVKLSRVESAEIQERSPLSRRNVSSFIA
jgi:hypothetical protein